MQRSLNRISLHLGHINSPSKFSNIYTTNMQTCDLTTTKIWRVIHILFCNKLLQEYLVL